MELLRACAEDVIVSYCISWAEYGACEIDILNAYRHVVSKYRKVEDIFVTHFSKIGIKSYFFILWKCKVLFCIA